MLSFLRQSPLRTGLPQTLLAAFLLAGCTPPQQDAQTSAAAKPQTAVASASAVATPANGEPATPGGPPQMRRLTTAQYYEAIADIFGPDIVVGAKFSPLKRTDGLMALNASTVAVTPSAFEQFDTVARSIATQALSPQRRTFVVPCKPKSETLPDDRCAAEFLSTIGKVLYRRPLLKDELKERVNVARKSAEVLGNFYEGLTYPLVSMLQSANFIFIRDVLEKDPQRAGAMRLDAYSIASKLSFLLWNSTPDMELLAAADRGELHTPDGLRRQADRLIASPRFESGVRAFFADMLEFERFDELTKDPLLYPAFSADVMRDSKEQTLRTIVYHLVTKKGDYRALFTTRQTFMSRALGIAYDVPVPVSTVWSPYEFAADDPRAGILTQLSFTALHSHPGRSSATLRGKAVREVFLCQKVPEPPGNVTFDAVEDGSNVVLKTARERLAAHANEPMCAGCHKITDPIGLVLESFDGAGQIRETENGAKIDTSGDLNGVKLQNSVNLANAMHDSPVIISCLAKRAYEYAAGRKASASEKPWMSYLEKQFKTSGHTIQALFRDIATSRALYAVSPPST